MISELTFFLLGNLTGVIIEYYSGKPRWNAAQKQVKEWENGIRDALKMKTPEKETIINFITDEMHEATK